MAAHVRRSPNVYLLTNAQVYIDSLSAINRAQQGAPGEGGVWQALPSRIFSPAQKPINIRQISRRNLKHIEICILFIKKSVERFLRKLCFSEVIHVSGKKVQMFDDSQNVYYIVSNKHSTKNPKGVVKTVSNKHSTKNPKGVELNAYQNSSHIFFLFKQQMPIKSNFRI